MPNFLLAVFVKFRKNYFGTIQGRKGRGRKKPSHTDSQLLAEREKKVNMNISSKFHTTTQKVGNQRNVRN